MGNKLFEKVQKKYKYIDKGSLTVEAAIILPVFICTIFSIIFFIKVLYVHSIINQAINSTASELAKYAYLYTIVDEKEFNNNTLEYTENGHHQAFISEIKKLKESFYKNPFKKTVKNSFGGYIEKLDATKDRDKILKSLHIKGGFDGIDFGNSNFFIGKDDIEIIAKYTIKVPIPFGNLLDIPMKHRAFVRAWLDGVEEKKYDEAYEEKLGIWDIEPKNRGRKIQKEYKRNLSSRFPVISSFNREEGKVTKVRSINIEAKTYENSKTLFSQIKSEIDELNEFDGAKVEESEIKNVDIKIKELIIVIPEIPENDMSENTKKVFKLAELYSKSKDILFRVDKKFGRSSNFDSKSLEE